MSWRDRVRGKLVAPDRALESVRSGDVIGVAPFTCTPYTLCRALAEHVRRRGLSKIRVDHPASLFPWTAPELRGAFELHDNYATAANRAACHDGAMEYVPISVWRAHEMPAGYTRDPDVFLVPVSPPNERGYCSFGPGVWMSGTAVRHAKRVIAEVHEDFIRTFGENYVHVDRIDGFVEAQEPTGSGAPAALPPEEREAVEVICNLVAAELIRDGDTVQTGVGTVSASLAPFLEFRNDLGVQTELITGGIAELVRKGVVTGRYKTLHRFKVVGSATVALAREELQEIHENPVFELYDFGYTDDLRRLVQIERFVTVNNALAVDLTGQVAAESFDARMYTGVGGQTVFMIAGAYSPGGRSVSVLPSSTLPAAGRPRASRIVPGLPPGTPVTVPRTFVDTVVTEHGIADLRGRSVRERAGALIEIAHPEFRETLRAEAHRLHAL
ncbi:MAG TPA: acetyl-CoA hydrolase/transferase C-terminal domain-containing protein [Myxococcota bacterium]|nr:acetyl-CoA hydrolase/transferase C-terminal domain-containing protein [Myxococcota bacterium]